MVEYKKGTILYYYNHPTIIRLVVDEDYFGTHGISAIFKIDKIISKGYAGSESRIKEGKRISANELQGIAIYGPKRYIFNDKYNLIKKILGG